MDRSSRAVAVARRAGTLAAFLALAAPQGAAAVAGDRPCAGLGEPAVVSYTGKEERLFTALLERIRQGPQPMPDVAGVALAFEDCLDLLLARGGLPEDVAAVMGSFRFGMEPGNERYRLTMAGETAVKSLPGTVRRLARRVSRGMTRAAEGESRGAVRELAWFLWFESVVASLGSRYNSYDYASIILDQKASDRGRSFSVGFEIELQESQAEIVEVSDPALAASGLSPGDLLLALDGRELSELAWPELQRYWLAEAPFRYEMLARGEQGERRLASRSIPTRHRTLSWAVQDGIGYIRIRRFADETLIELRRALRSLDQQEVEGLILDVRNNPGGILSTGLVDVFLRPGQTVSSYRDHGGGEPVDVAATIEFWGRPMVLLQDGRSASMAENLAAALKTHGRAVLVGETSRGKGVGQTVYPILDEGRLHLVTRTYFYPGTRETWDGTGVAPEREIAPSDGDREELDRLLDAPVLSLETQWKIDPALREAARVFKEVP